MSKRNARSVRITKVLGFSAIVLALLAPSAWPQGQGTFALKVYHVNFGFYPIVEAYVRTWDENQEPKENVNIANIGVQVKGKNYDPKTAILANQYGIETLEKRGEGFRTVVVLDASGSMAVEPFADALNALKTFVEAKRPSDQIAVLAIRDTDTGYAVVSPFESNPTMLYQRIRDVKPDGQKTRLYDAVAGALEMGATAFGDTQVVLTTIVVLSDGNDEGSAVTRSELINRIGQLNLPLPIHSVAFTKGDKTHLQNIEALSTATFGRYWNLDDTKQLSTTMQHIHRINRSDYVVTFRAYVPVDGVSYTFRVGVEYPSGTGKFMYGSAAFEAMDSPAAMVTGPLNSRYEQLKAKYPCNPQAVPWDGPSECGPPPPVPAGEPIPPVPIPAPPDYLLIAAIGVGLLVLVAITMMWVKQGNRVSHSDRDGRDTRDRTSGSSRSGTKDSGTRTTDDPKN